MKPRPLKKPKARRTWGALRPTTKVKPSAKTYRRPQQKTAEECYSESKKWTAREAAVNRYLQDNDQ